MIKVINTQRIIIFFLIAIAVAMQVQISLFATGDYLGIRINLADFILPFAGLYVLFLLITQKTHYPRWLNKYIQYIIFVLLSVLTIALINGYFNIGEWSSWALINKYIGFIILLCYFFLAGWIVTNFGHNRIFLIFSKYFCMMFIVTLVLSLFAVLLQPFVGMPLWIGNFAWDGFMANRNAYMIAAIFTMILLLSFSDNHKTLLSFWWYAIFWMIIPIFVIYNASRTGWVFGGVIICAYIFKNPLEFLKQIAPFILIGSILAYVVFNFISVGEVKENTQYHHFVTSIKQTFSKENISYGGDQNRYIALEDGLELYQKSNFILGAGLGVYKFFQIKKRGKFINIIDCSALWLLTETGLLGLISFSIFFLFCLSIFYQKGVKEKSFYHMSLLVFLIVIIFMSFLHELLYTRFLWFALGLGMATKAPTLDKSYEF